LAAIAIRVYVYVIGPPSIISERQFRSALISRAYYFESSNTIPEWRKRIASTSKQRAGILEPPIFEFLVSSIYRIIDGEHLWIARVLSSVFWLIGGVFLFKIAERVTSADAALIAVTYYLFVPLGIITSLSFQPDPIMIMMFLISLHVILKHNDQTSLSKLFFAGCISGLTIFIRPLILFTILSAFTSLAICREKTWKIIFRLQFIIFVILSLMPAILFYGYGIIFAGFLRWKVETSFIPQLLFSSSYWKDWLQTAIGAVGFTPLITALLGVPMLRKGLNRDLMIGLGIGYVIYCIIFSYHIRFASYYHLQLVPIIALSIAPLIILIANHLRNKCNKWYLYIPVTCAVLLVILFNIHNVRNKIIYQARYENEKLAEEIGSIVNHSIRTIHLASYYGMPLEYFGELSGAYWSRSISDRDRALGINRVQSVEERLNDLDFSPEYFIITDFRQFERHHSDLEKFLTEKCSIIAKTDKYLIYGQCSK
jgi:4-amino-4-deoxy-L-arabinose transferase-like glycosyltransferase